MRSKTHRRIICGLLILPGILLIGAVNANTHFLLNATAGILERTVDVAPNSEYVHSLLSWVYYKLNNTEKADAAFDQAHINTIKKTIQENPNDADAYFYLGQKYHHKGQLEQAIESYLKAKQLNSNHIWLWESLGEAYIDSQQYDKAIATYKEGMALLKNHPVWSSNSKNVLNCYLGLEFAYMKLERVEEARACREKALQLWPSTADYYFCFGNLFKKKGDWENAVALYKSSLEMDPNNIEIQNSLDTAYLEMNKQDNKTGLITKTTFALEAELDQLAQQVKRERQKIEDQYAGDYAKFSVWAEKRISELDHEQEAAYKTFQRQLKERKAAVEEASNENAPDYNQRDGNDDPVNNTIPSVLGDPAKQYELVIEQIEKERDFIYQEFSRLRAARDRGLRGLEDYERNAKDRILSEMRRAERLKDDETIQSIGMIQSISMGAGRGYRVMVEGEFYSEGDTVNGCRIISINEDGIKYAKKGSVYQQALN